MNIILFYFVLLTGRLDKIDKEISKVSNYAKKVENTYYGTFKKTMESLGEVIISDHPER